MSCLYDTVEPSVISEEMLMQAVVAQGPVDEAGRIAKEEGIEFRHVKSLRLDFINILRIDGLWEFVNLTKLQLDNNIIERIEGIDKLVNLLWLDLSFNNIEVIEGLDTLTQLQDLSLFNNHITCIENMDNLVSLQIFSIGNNDLKDLENLIYLRPFKNLKTLNLSNNPFCYNEEYKLYAAAFLPGLDFLDYRLLDQQTKDAGYEKHALQIDTLLDDEKRQRSKDEEAEQKAKDLEYHTKVFVDNLDESQLFDSMYEDDPDGHLLNQMPDLGDGLDVFREKFAGICQKIFNFGMNEHEKREQEMAVFWECVNEAKQENKEEGQAAIREFQIMKKKLFKELVVTTDPKAVQQMVDDYNNHVTELWDKLMGLEMTLLEQLEEVIGNLDRNMQELVASFLENLQGYMTFLREAENLHMEAMVDISHVTGDRVNKSELDDEISDELRSMFIDKDTVSTALQTSHDAHLLKIDNKEDDIIKRVNSWMSNMMKEMHEEQEIKRNRARVIEISHLIDHFREEIDNLEMTGP